MENKPTQTEAETLASLKALAKANPPTPEDEKRWATMAQGFVDNLNKNVLADDKGHSV